MEIKRDEVEKWSSQKKIDDAPQHAATTTGVTPTCAAHTCPCVVRVAWCAVAWSCRADLASEWRRACHCAVGVPHRTDGHETSHRPVSDEPRAPLSSDHKRDHGEAMVTSSSERGVAEVAPPPVVRVDCWSPHIVAAGATVNSTRRQQIRSMSDRSTRFDRCSVTQ
jgi:hypothetical protein